MALGVGKKASGMLAGLPEAGDPGPMTVHLAPGCPAAGVDGGSTWRRAAGAELTGSAWPRRRVSSLWWTRGARGVGDEQERRCLEKEDGSMLRMVTRPHCPMRSSLAVAVQMSGAPAQGLLSRGGLGAGGGGGGAAPSGPGARRPERGGREKKIFFFNVWNMACL